MQHKYILLATATALVLGSCKSKIKPDMPEPGEANFATYVAIGNSLTAGFADGTLYRSGQQNSYPSMLAGQFKLVGGGEFKQPLLPGEAGWPIIPAAGRYPKRVLGPTMDCLGVPSLGPVLFPGALDTAGSAANISVNGPYNNVGIPGIRCIDFGFAGYGALNPYAARFFADPFTQKPLEVALRPVPTFFSVWLGGNDVLGYATAGGEGLPVGTGLSDISPLSAFKATYDASIQALVNIGAKGVLINIPEVTSIPFFTTINPKGLTLSAEQAGQLTAAYAAMGLTHVTFEAGANYFVVEDETVGARKLKAGEYVLLTTPGDSLKCGGWGSIQPIPKQYVLTEDEVANVRNATQAFNQVIADNASRHNLALVDANTYLKTLQSGITWNGVTYTPAFVTGGAFSLDGIHLTPRGYALVANEILRMINQRYNASIPAVDVNKYSGIRFP
jgi:lysophospholipase L1-like esterase